MKRLGIWLRNLFNPPSDSPRWIRTSTFFLSGLLFLGLVIGGAYGWEYTNSPDFCGTGCHSMPPEYTAYQLSPHSEIKCVECHIGRDFIGSQLTRKIGDIRHVIAHLSGNYEYPIHVKTLRPAEEVCQECHNPDKYSDSSQREIVRYAPDPENTFRRIYITLFTGGGRIEDGLGKGIHWHVQNPVYFYATDPFEQDIPYVKVVNEQDGFTTEYIDISSGFNRTSISDADLKKMDCITCHNRISHSIPAPSVAIDTALSRGLISSDIPEIRQVGEEFLMKEYTTREEGFEAIPEIMNFYEEKYPSYLQEHRELVQTAINVLLDIYDKSVFPEQQVRWDTHADNLGHTTFEGCFRCHDGEHFELGGRAIPQECSTCHSIPVVVGDDSELVQITISNQNRPTTHNQANWLALHRYMYDPEDPDEACSGCHDVTNYDLADDSSFCANSICHGSGIETVDIREISSDSIRARLLQLFPHYPPLLADINPWTDHTSLEDLHFTQTSQEPIECVDCHDPFPPAAQPPNSACLACHGETISGLQEITSMWEPNPHDQHEGNVSCSFCHPNFGPQIEPCALCHENEPMELVGEANE